MKCVKNMQTLHKTLGLIWEYMVVPYRSRPCKSFDFSCQDLVNRRGGWVRKIKVEDQFKPRSFNPPTWPRKTVYSGKAFKAVDYIQRTQMVMVQICSETRSFLALFGQWLLASCIRHSPSAAWHIAPCMFIHMCDSNETSPKDLIKLGPIHHLYLMQKCHVIYIVHWMTILLMQKCHNNLDISWPFSRGWMNTLIWLMTDK